MSAWPFLTFTALFAAAIAAHFAPAYRCWRKTRGEEPSDIDPDYVRLNDYFAQSFRLKLGQWLKLPIQSAMPDGTRTVRKGSETIRISGALEHPPRSRSADILAVQGAFRCGAGCTFSREIHVRADARIGAGSRLQAIAADGDLTLGPGVRVARWADSRRDLEIPKGCVVKARATAGRIIRLEAGAKVGSAAAPAVFSGLNGQPSRSIHTPPAPEAEFPAQRRPEPSTPASASLRVDRRRLRQLSPECLLYQGDFSPAVPLRVMTKLIVKGECVIPAGSILEEDLKADGRITIGAGSVCRGSVIGGGDILFEPGSVFLGIVHAGRNVRLAKGVRGGAEDSMTVAFAEGAVTLEEGVEVHGKLAAGEHVTVAEKIS